MPRKSIQIKISKFLLARLDLYLNVNTGRTKSLWIEDAIQKLLETEKPLPIPLIATQLLHNRTSLLISLHSELLYQLDGYVYKNGYTRTTVILDAITTKLQRSGYVHSDV